MTYNPNSPIGPVPPRDQVDQVRNNFSTFDTIFKVNHTALNDPNQGKHEKIIFNKQLVDPGVTEDLDVLYSKNATSNVSTQPQIFLQIPEFLPTKLDTSKPGNPPMQLTYNTVNIVGPNQFQSFLPGGYLFYFGSTTDITVPITLSPIPTSILAAIAIPNTMTIAGTPVPYRVSTKVLSNSQFQIFSADATIANPYSFTWLAIGLA